MPGGPGRGADVMELTLLTVPACPSAAAFEERLAAALAGHPGADVRRREVAGEREAAEAGGHGSPTPPIDGTDPVFRPGAPPRLSLPPHPGPTRRAAPPP